MARTDNIWLVLNIAFIFLSYRSFEDFLETPEAVACSVKKKVRVRPPVNSFLAE